MTNETLEVRANIITEKHEMEYWGSISIDGVNFGYMLKLDLPIEELRKLGNVSAIEEKAQFGLIDQDKKPVPWKDSYSGSLFGALITMLLKGAYDFQEGFGNIPIPPELSNHIGMFLSEPRLGIFTTGTPVGNEMQTSFKLQKTPELEKLLQAYRK